MSEESDQLNYHINKDLKRLLVTLVISVAAFIGLTFIENKTNYLSQRVTLGPANDPVANQAILAPPTEPPADQPVESTDNDQTTTAE